MTERKLTLPCKFTRPVNLLDLVNLQGEDYKKKASPWPQPQRLGIDDHGATRREWEGDPLQTVSLGMLAGDSGRLGDLAGDDSPDIYSVRRRSEDRTEVPVVRETRKAKA